MSIRDFTPRANRRRAQSTRTKVLLGIVLAAAILLQIPYPLLDGRALDLNFGNCVLRGGCHVASCAAKLWK